MKSGRLVWASKEGRPGLSYDRFVTDKFNRMLAIIEAHLLLYTNKSLMIYLNARSIESRLRTAFASPAKHSYGPATRFQMVDLAPGPQFQRAVPAAHEDRGSSAPRVSRTWARESDQRPNCRGRSDDGASSRARAARSAHAPASPRHAQKSGRPVHDPDAGYFESQTRRPLLHEGIRGRIRAPRS
jgi:hypothetical protein